MWTSEVILFIVAIFFGLTTQNKINKLTVSIYYETLCDDSIRFVADQLAPAYELIGEYLDMNWIPYGKAYHRWDGGRYQFGCQHGNKECYGNTIHACAIMHQSTQADIVKFVNCTMGVKDLYSEKEIVECAEKCNLIWNEIKRCVNGQLGNTLLAHFGDMTSYVSPRITFVPTIIFNERYDRNLQQKALNDFFTTACDLLESSPSKCPKRNQMPYKPPRRYYYSN